MTIRREIVISHAGVFGELPADLRELFSREEREAYESGSRMFKNSAQQTGERALISLLEDVKNDDPFSVFLRRSDPDPWIIWFSFRFPHRKRRPLLRPPRDHQFARSIPRRVRRLYDGLGGIDDMGGILPPELIISGDDLGSAASGSVDPTTCFFFFSFGNGDYLGWSTEGQGVFFNHETREIELEENVDALIDAFLQELLEPAENPYGGY